MSYFPGMQKGNLDSIKADEHGKIKKETVALQGVSVTRVTFGVGAKWRYSGANGTNLTLIFGPGVAHPLKHFRIVIKSGPFNMIDLDHHTSV